MEWKVTTGMSLRDYFAASALTGLLLDSMGSTATKTTMEMLVIKAYGVSDAMMEHRKECNHDT